MSPVPAQFTDRWGDRRTGASYQDCVCWHLLLGTHPAVRAAAAGAQQRLARFGGMYMTPARWLHVTVLRAGPAATITPHAMEHIIPRAPQARPHPRPAPGPFQKTLAVPADPPRRDPGGGGGPPPRRNGGRVR